MERLTQRTKNGGVTYESNDDYIITCYPANNNLRPTDKMAVRLCEFEDKLESGQLVELPCKVGDMVYQVHDKCNGGERCLYNDGFGLWRCNYDGRRCEAFIQETQFSYLMIDKLGKTVFVDKTQAEAHLKKLQVQS